MHTISRKLTRGQSLLKEVLAYHTTNTFLTDFLEISPKKIFKISEGAHFPLIEQKLLGACEFLKLLKNEKKRQALQLMIEEFNYRHADCPTIPELTDYADKHGG